MSKHRTAGRTFLAIGLVLSCTLHLLAEYRPLTQEEQRKVNQAIERGVHFLKSQQFSKGPHAGTWLPHPVTDTHYRVGHTLMPTLALLESGVSADDPVIQRAARLLRRVGPTLDWTYELSLAVLVLDRLKDPQDKPLLTSLALRLVAGQCRTGGWTYWCPKLTVESETALLRLLHDEAAGGRREDVPKSLRVLTIFQDPQQLPWLDPTPTPGQGGARKALYIAPTDNSNTQFAMLALLAAQRYKIPMLPTFRLTVKRFQTSQNPDGTWEYRYRMKWSRTRSMTTVGLLGLAIGEGLLPSGAKGAGREIDPGILRGFAALAGEIDEPSGQMQRRLPQPDLYFLWSVERVAMLYNLAMIGNRDWYRWGVEILVSNQTRRGDWPAATVDVLRPITGEVRDAYSTYGPAVNTSFALLFLKRCNLTKDLTAKLPYKPEELNKGIVQILQNPLAIPQTEPTSRSRSRQHD